VVLPSSIDQVSRILAYCHREGIKVVHAARHFPLGWRASARRRRSPWHGKFSRIREIDYDNRVVVAEPGVTNLAVTQAVEQRGFYYARSVLADRLHHRRQLRRTQAACIASNTA